MTRPRVLAHVEDPGAANGFVALGAELSRCGIDLSLVAEGSGATVLNASATPFEAREGESASALLDRVRPEFVLVGTSENTGSVAHDLVAEARGRRISTAAFVDASPNAAHRFRGATTDALAHAPDFLLVPDEVTGRAYAALGFPEERIEWCGHPIHDAVLEARVELQRKGRSLLRDELVPAAGDRRVVIFCTEISGGLDGGQFSRSPAYTLAGRGQRTGRTEVVIEELVDALRTLAPDVYLVLRLHPKHAAGDLGDLLAEADQVSSAGSPLPLLFAADLIVGMSSTILVEASLLGRPTLSILPRQEEREWLPTIASGTTPCATTRAELHAALQRFTQGRGMGVPIEAVPGASRRMAEWVALQVRRA